MNNKAKVLIVDDDETLRHALKQSLSLADFSVNDFSQGSALLSQISRDSDVVIVADIRMPGLDGMALLAKVLDIDPALPVILITGHGDVSTAVDAMRIGAYDFIEKPFPTDRLINAVGRALEKRRLVLENRVLRLELSGQDGLDKRIIGRTPLMLKLRAEITALASADVDVLVMGETGAGKDVVARALHEDGKRKDKPFIALNCGAIPTDMMESELFGHESGAFTSANKMRVGKLEHANGGTIFLDEIESMPLELQVKLLRVIETRSIERLGSNKTIDLDIRFIAATKVDLNMASEKGEFRSDLYYRLNVIALTIPPLRDRKEDVPALVHHLAREARARYRREIPDITTEFMAKLIEHDWPGNVRELRNWVDRWVLGVSDTLTQSEETIAAPIASDLSSQMASFEKKLISSSLKNNKGSLRKTYEQLGISRKALYEKMKKYDLHSES